MSQSITSIDTIDKPLDNIIYKVKLIINKKIDSVFIFNGQKNKNNTQNLKNIFTEKELDEFQTDTKIIFCDQRIHPDDSIITIKIKILNQFSKKDISLEEIYLFCQKIEKLNSIAVYQSLTQNKKLSLTKIRLEQFLSNVTDLEGNKIKEPEDKDIYSYDDIFEMKLEDKEYIVNKVLGQKFFIVENEYPFICNPFDVKEYDKFLEQNSRKTLSTLNNHLLLNSGEILNNTIYLCLANDVLNYAQNNNIPQQTTLKIYYPFLYNKNINSIEDLNKKREELINSNKKIDNEKILNLFKTINMFYGVYDLRKNDLKYIGKGIKFIKAVMKPDFDVKIPLEIIFKIIHATELNPLIKYNPSSRQENIYRLYTDKISTDGRKIPYLKKSAILKLTKAIGRNKSVSIYIETQESQILNCEFDEEGYITMVAEFDSLVDVSHIDDIFRKSINPIIQEIKSTLEQSGYKLNLFNSLNDANVEIKQMTYETNVQINKNFDIETYKNCISSIFINETDKYKGSKLKLRFKRVSNYSKFTSQEAFILEKAQQGLRGQEIYQALLENFPEDLTQEQAIELVRKVANELEVERGVRKTDIKIKENPGFRTEISVDLETATLKIITDNIDNINYLYTLPIYLDTIIRLTQDKGSTTYPISEINILCGAEEPIDISFPEITSSSELSANQGENIVIEGDESVEYEKYDEKEKPKGALSLFFDDDDSLSTYESEGGQPSSEESISSDISEEKLPKKLTYAGITVPSGISSESIPTDESDSNQNLLVNIEKPNSESSISSFASSLKKDTESSKESIKSLGSFPDIVSSESSVITEKPTTPVSLNIEQSEESIASEKQTTPVVSAVIEKSESITPSEESIASEKQTTPVVSAVIEKSESITPSEESIASEKQTTPVVSAVIEKSESIIPSEESIASEKQTTPVVSAVIEKSESIRPSEESIASEKQTTPVVSAVIEKSESITPSEESIASEKQTTPVVSAVIEKSESITPSKESIVTEKIITPVKISQEKEKSKTNEDISEDYEVEEEDVRNIDGMKLNKPYYFQTLIEKRDPVLIVKEDTPEYNGYSRTCLSDKRRQPVILTDSQLDKINKEYPNFLREQDVIKYGSDEKHQFNYICPRFWCLKNNTIIDPKDIKQIKGKDGKMELIHQPAKGPSCGKVLPKKEKKVKPGYYIYEFYDEGDEAYPGLIPDKHPNGLCLPCCFKNYNTEGRIKAKQKCLENISNKDKEKAVQQKKEELKIPEKEDSYILGPEKFPLEPGRWGYLPPEIQTMLHEVNADCQISKTNTNIKPNHPCLLRHGVEVNKKQSFISCISDIIFYGKRIIDEENRLTTKTARVLNNKEMRNRISKAINIDTFIKYQNGNLVIDFYDKDRKVDIEKYNNSKLYGKLNLKNTEERIYLTKVISAYENFKLFLDDDDAIIDHTYLWDIISMPNKYLFPNGVNIVIFQLPHDDITNNVQLLCPTNHYSNEFYEARKPTIILIKEDGYYEPVYSYLIDGKNIKITKEFKEYDPQLSKTMRAVFKELIKPFFEQICRPLDSMPNIYKAKRPLLLYDLVQKLDKYEYKIIKLVMNFNNKIIGVLAEEPGISERKCFIPCYPSSLNENLKLDLDYVFMNDLTLWNTYTNTIQFLNKLSNRSGKRRDNPDIPCKPAFKIVEDEHVVGILTNTNQFIQISEPIRIDEIEPELDLPSITDDDYIVRNYSNQKGNQILLPMKQSDSIIITENKVDEVREDYIKKIKLETSFYNVFRNTIRILLNNYENIKVREKIEAEMSKEYIIYTDKLVNINKLLKELVGDKIQFIGDKNFYKIINEVSTCIVKDNKQCTDSPNLCVLTNNGNCNLILPERNLITNKENKEIYFGRMADELIRYNRIKVFMLQPQIYLSFGNIGYNLRDDEIILIQSTLTQEYFDSLIPAVTNKYVKLNSYDETEPIITQIYDNKIPSLDQAIGRNNLSLCNRIDREHITSSIWKKCFPDNYMETEYSKYNYCTFNFVIDLIEKKTNHKYTINEIKNILFTEYKNILPNNQDKIIDILIYEGKKTLGDQVKSETLSFSNFIYTDSYFLTPFDLWLIVNKFKIPTIFISHKFIMQSKNGKYEKHEFVAYGDENDKFAFIVIPGLRAENVPNFKIIKTDKGDIFISLNKLNQECVERIKEAMDNKVSIDEYINNYKISSKYKYERKKPKELLVETDSEEQERKKQSKKKKLIIEETSPVAKETAIIEKNKPTKKVLIRGEPKNKTRRQQGLKKRRLLIVESSDTEKV
jgi:hypothetical protein